MADGKQPSDWTIIQDGSSACDWTRIQDGEWKSSHLIGQKFKMADGTGPG